jgi:hypothetical protein
MLGCQELLVVIFLFLSFLGVYFKVCLVHVQIGASSPEEITVWKEAIEKVSNVSGDL